MARSRAIAEPRTPYSETGERRSSRWRARARRHPVLAAARASRSAVFVAGRAAIAPPPWTPSRTSGSSCSSPARARPRWRPRWRPSLFSEQTRTSRPLAYWTLALRFARRLSRAAGGAGSRRRSWRAAFAGRVGRVRRVFAPSRAALSVHVGAHDEALVSAPDDARVVEARVPAPPRSLVLDSGGAAARAAAELARRASHPANDRDAIATYRVRRARSPSRVERAGSASRCTARGAAGGRGSPRRRAGRASSRGRARARGQHLGADADADAGDEKETEKRRRNAARAGAAARVRCARATTRLEVLRDRPRRAAGADAVRGRGPAAGARAHALRGPAGASPRRAFRDRGVRGCAVAAQGATRRVSPGDAVLGDGGSGLAAHGPPRRRGGRVRARARTRRGQGRVSEALRAPRADPTDPTDAAAASAAAAARRRGDLCRAETLLNVLDVPRARRPALPRRGAGRERPIRAVARRRLARAAPRAATALCVAACLGEWRAADALDHLDHLAASRPTRVFANDTREHYAHHSNGRVRLFTRYS